MIAFVCPECGESSSATGKCPRDGTALVSNAGDPLVGVTVGSYRVARLIGAGGIGRVYLGVQPAIGSRVAIKVLSRDCAARADLVERFFAEARAVNLIRHEGIVNVLDLTHLLDGLPVIIMEYLDGEPLSILLRRHGAAPLGTLADLAGQILDALEASHQKGVVHRDLKPDNVVVTPAGRAKVLDFGIAKLRPEHGTAGMLTQAGIVLGTPHYMAPEQAKGLPVDLRTDLYAMGVILFEGVTGRRLFDGGGILELLQHHLNTAPPAPRTLRDGLPPAYEKVILRSLEKDPTRRFSSAKEMAAALQAATDGLPREAWASMTRADTGAGARRPTPPPAPTRRPQTAPLRPASRPVTTRGKAPSPRPDRRTLRTVVLAAAVATVVASTSFWIKTREKRSASTVPPSDGRAASLPSQPSSNEPRAPLIATPAASPSTSVRPTDTVPGRTLPSSPRTPPEPMTRTTPSKSSPTPPPPSNEPVSPAEPMDPPAPSPSPAAEPRSWRDAPYQKPLPPFTVPRDYDANAFEPLPYTPRALALAQKMAADVAFVELRAQGVRPNGRVDLTLSPELDVEFVFRSPHRSQRGAGVPIGLDEDRYCLVVVELTREKIQVASTFSISDCADAFRPLPRCSLRTIWERALKRGAPRGNAIAEIDYLSHDGKWFFTIDDVISETFDDDCPRRP